MKNKTNVLTWISIVAALLFINLTGCGGGGGGVTTPTPAPAKSTLTGTVAAGAAIIGTVTIQDSSTPKQNIKTVQITDGKYTVVVPDDWTAPYALRADGDIGGTKYQLYSAAVPSDLGNTINITPFTDLILSNIAGDLAANYFDSSNYTSLTKADLDSAQAALKAKLQPILTSQGLADSIDLLRTSFSVDHKGLDGVLDALKVTVDPATKTAEIKFSDTVKITDDLKSKSDADAFSADDAAAVTAGLTDLQAIKKGFDEYSKLFATSLPSADDPRLLAFYDQATYMNDGRNLDAELGRFTTDPFYISLKFTNVSIISLDPNAGTGEVAFDVIIQGRTMNNAPRTFKMIRKNNVWLMQGNQRIAHVFIEVQSNLNYKSGGTTPEIQSGLWLTVSDRGNKGTIKTAIVKGPGLPAAGVTLINDIASGYFTIQPSLPNSGGGWFYMDDATIGSIPDGSVYTIHLRDATDVVIATYTETIRKRPYKVSELTIASFPAITAPTLAEFRAFSGGTLNVTWTIPAGLQSGYVVASLWGSSGSVQVEKQVGPTETAKSLTLQPQTATGATFAISNRNLEVGAVDSYGRYLKTHCY